MNRILVLLGMVLSLALSTNQSHGGEKSLPNCGDKPWWNMFAKSNKGLPPEEERLQKFWHDYYDALGKYYGALDHMDWVAYYKNHGNQINGGCAGPGCCKSINYAPVFIRPTMQWAVPNTSAGGPPAGSPGAGR